MEKILVLLGIIAVLAQTLFAQVSPQKDWDQRIGGGTGNNNGTLGAFEELYSVKTMMDGYLLIGLTKSNRGQDVSDTTRDINGGNPGDYWVVKTNLNGIKIRDKRFGHYNAEVAYDALISNDLYYLVGLSTSQSIGGDKSENSNGGWDIWVIKTDSNNNKLWDQVIGGAGNEICRKIFKLTNQRLMLLGESASDLGFHKSENSRGLKDIWIIKIDSSGNKLWDKTFGGDNDDLTYTNTFIQMNPDSFLLGASSKSGISGEKTETNRGDYDYWIVKIDSNGVIAWDKTYGGSSTDFLYAVQQTPDRGYVLGGWSNSSVSGDKTAPNLGGYDYWVVKTDANGNKLWDKTFGGSGNDRLYAIEIDLDGNILLGGYTDTGLEGDKTENSRGGNDIWLLKIDQDGNKIWDKSFGGSGNDRLQSFSILGTDIYLLGGISDSPADGDKSQPTWGFSDFWIIKTKPGDPLAFQEITLKTQSYQNTVYLNWADAQANDPHYAVLRLKSQNPFVWDTLGYTSKTFYSDIRPKNGHNFYQICRVENDNSCLLSNIAQASFTQTASSVAIYPNPAADLLTVHFGTVAQTQIQVMDMKGMVVYQTESQSQSTEIELSNRNEGVYLLRVNYNGQTYTEKLVIVR